MKGIVSNIQEFSVQDGPGVRTTVFMQGCNLRCVWCHNPETWEMKPRLVFRLERCISCGACVVACPAGAIALREGILEVDRTHCQNCGTCVKTCYSGALSLSGAAMTAADVCKRLLDAKPYFDNGAGGVTFSGGECMLQMDFLEECLRFCKESGIHTAVDTAGHVLYEFFRRIMPLTDIFLYDLKEGDPERHRALMGVPDTLIWENLTRLLADGARVIVRVPCVPGANWDDMPRLAERLAGLPVESVELCHYHRLGEGKFEFLGLDAQTYATPSNRDMERLVPLFKLAKRTVTYTRQ